jgi:hypothetical protein
MRRPRRSVSSVAKSLAMRSDVRTECGLKGEESSPEATRSVTAPRSGRPERRSSRRAEPGSVGPSERWPVYTDSRRLGESVVAYAASSAVTSPMVSGCIGGGAIVSIAGGPMGSGAGGGTGGARVLWTSQSWR